MGLEFFGRETCESVELLFIPKVGSIQSCYFSSWLALVSASLPYETVFTLSGQTIDVIVCADRIMLKNKLLVRFTLF